MSARILICDLETQRGIVETFSLFRPFIGIDRVIKPSRILSFAAKWRGDDEVTFGAAWDDDDEDAYLQMIQALFDLFSEADYIVTWNGTRFDLQWVESECGRLGLGRPTPYKNIDLIQTNKKWFRGGQMSMKLDWSARHWLKDAKVKHGGSDLWHDIRYGTDAEKLAAQELMERYNIHDTILTEMMFEAYLPWLNINLGLHDHWNDELLRCVKCASTNLKMDGKKYHATTAGLYQMYRCKECGSTSRGKRMKSSTELRPV